MKLKHYFLIAALATFQFAVAQQPAATGGDAPPSQGARKSIEIKRTELEPRIDGVLDDALWKEATVIADLHQFEPVDHGTPSEKSEF